jgi:outer membrane protein, heavy metal efflux system
MRHAWSALSIAAFVVGPVAPTHADPPAPSSLAIARQPAPPPASVPLEALLARVLSESPLREAAFALVEGARDAVPLASRFANPLLELRQENWNFGARGASDPLLDVFAVVTQPIELGGKRAARRQLAEAERSMTEAALADVERQLSLAVVDRYVEAVRLREWTITLADERDSLQELTDVMRRRADEGAAAEADHRRLEAELTRVDAELLRAQLGLDAALLALEALLPDGTPVEPASLVVPAPAAVPPFLPEATLDEAIERVPAVTLARARAERAARQLRLERAVRVPDLQVSGGYKRTDGAHTGVVGVVLPVPLFDRNGVAIARASGEARAAGLGLEAVRREARAELQATLRAARSLASRSTRTPRELVAPAEVVRRAARAMFREGSGDVLHLVDAERVYATAQREALALTLDAVLASARARLALGESLTP